MSARNFTDANIHLAPAVHLPPPPYSAAAALAAQADASQNDYDLTPLPQSMNRPRLPVEKRNPYLGELDEDSSLVKFQTIVRENREIVVGRIKIPTPGGGHAFVLRRYDTDAISLTTMYKVAFPGATEEEEKRELDWVKSSFDIRNTNGGRDCDAVKLAGQWVSRQLAIHVAPAYGLKDLTAALARAVPDPNIAYRKSQRSQIATNDIARANTTTRGPAPAIAPAAEEPQAKRRRDASPARAGGSSNEEVRHVTVEAVTTLTGPRDDAQAHMEAEIAQAKQMVVDLRRELQLRSAAGQELEDTGAVVTVDTRGRKRTQADDDEGIALSGGAAKDARVIRTNQKVEAIQAGNTTATKLAWGTVMFGLGVGAAALLPSYIAQFF